MHDFQYLEETFHELSEGEVKALREQDPNGKNPHEPGAKLDAGKIPVFQGILDYFPRALMAVAEVSAFGASKYAWKGWESVPEGRTRYKDASIRHMMYRAMGEHVDPDSGLLHECHEVWNHLAALELKLRERAERSSPPDFTLETKEQVNKSADEFHEEFIAATSEG